LTRGPQIIYRKGGYDAAVMWDGIIFTLVLSETELAQRLFKMTDKYHGTIKLQKQDKTSLFKL
jgi:hypothetical protein